MPKVITKKAGLASKLKEVTNKSRTHPLWDGPCSNTPNGGITQSLLSGYIVCKERFRINVVEGLGEEERFNKSMDYGSLWHICEEHFARGEDWEKPLVDACRGLCRKYMLQQEEIEKWMNVCRLQFPLYVDFWKKHPDITKRTPLLQEKMFCIPYVLPSGRTAYLRGKMDSVDLVTDKKRSRIVLMENKSKGDLNEAMIQRNLLFDLQVMFYVVALEEYIKENGPLSKESDGVPFNQVRYNCIRRPLSGGKGSIVQKKGSKNIPPETKQEFYNRLAEYIREDPAYFFMRWNVDLMISDVSKFKTEFMNPCLDNLLDDYEWWEWCFRKEENTFCYGEREVVFPNHRLRHYRTPFGIYNPLAENVSTPIDEYLLTGSTVGLVRRDTLFSELK
jgi:hypothetical protein